MKTLGVYIDRYMLYDVHINELNKKVMDILMYIYRISDKLDVQNRIIIVATLVLSLIVHCIKIWGTINAKHMYNVTTETAELRSTGGIRRRQEIRPCISSA